MLGSIQCFSGGSVRFSAQPAWPKEYESARVALQTYMRGQGFGDDQVRVTVQYNASNPHGNKVEVSYKDYGLYPKLEDTLKACPELNQTHPRTWAKDASVSVELVANPALFWEPGTIVQ